MESIYRPPLLSGLSFRFICLFLLRLCYVSFSGVRRPVGTLLQITGRGQKCEIRRESLRSLEKFTTGRSEFPSSPSGIITNGCGSQKKGRVGRRSRLLLGKVSAKRETSRRENLVGLDQRYGNTANHTVVSLQSEI